MTSLEDKVFQCASGEKRLNPDELRQYFGTYAERVVLAVLLEDAELVAIKVSRSRLVHMLLLLPLNGRKRLFKVVESLLAKLKMILVPL